MQRFSFHVRGLEEPIVVVGDAIDRDDTFFVITRSGRIVAQIREAETLGWWSEPEDA